MQFSFQPRQVLRVCILNGILFGIYFGTPAFAQVPNQTNSQVSVNYVYAALLGLGTYEAGGLSVDVFTLPLQYTFDSHPNSDTQIRLKLPISYGRFGFEGIAPDGTGLGFDVDTLGTAPGVEFLIPLMPQWTLKPFGNLGLVGEISESTNTPQTQVEFPLNYLYIVGIRSLASQQIQDITLSLGNALIYAGNGAFEGGGVESFTAVETGLDVRFPLGFQFKSYRPDMNLFFIHYHFFPNATFTRFLQEPLRVKDQFEFGGSLGLLQPLDIGMLTNLRLGASYRFGGGLTAIVINFGFPF